MTDSELLEFVSEFRAGILNDGPAFLMCFAVCAPLATLLHIHGVEVELIESDLETANHYFLLLEDGRVLDPTADQFNEFYDEQMPPVYLGPPTALHQVNAPVAS